MKQIPDDQHTKGKRMRICFILEYYHPHFGGVEYLFKNLAEGLSARGHDVSVLTQRVKNAAAEEVVNGVKIKRIGTLNRYLFSFLAIPHAISISRDCDIIQTTTYNGAFPAWVAARIRRKKSMLTVHEVWIGKWRTLTEMSALSAFTHNLLEKIIYLLRFDAYVAISRSTERDLIKQVADTRKVSAIYHGFDHDFFKPEKYDGSRVRKLHHLEDRFVCFSWGRPGVSKGHEFYLRAVPLILKSIPNAKFLLMLSGRETYRKRYKYLMGLITKLNIADKVIPVDPVPREELGDYLKAADCVIIPSLAEGFGYAVIEASSMGGPVVASDSTSIPEVIGGKHVLVRPKSAEAIAQGVVGVHRKEYITSEVKIFPWKETISSYIALYERLLSSPSGK